MKLVIDKLGAAAALIVVVLACERDEVSRKTQPASGDSEVAGQAPLPAIGANERSNDEPPRKNDTPVATDAGNEQQVGGARASAGARDESSCPDGMLLVPGGEYWVGSPGTEGPPDEHPRYRTKLASYCLDRTEVTTAAYAACVEAGGCDPAARPQVNCNFGRPGREQHPINCVTWEQANAYCTARGVRLPTEAEWEVAARGGHEYRAYSWGADPPSIENTCWKRPRSCPVGQFPAGAFGLLDMIGNVWEWTASHYGDYPWPPEEGPHRVYRGGSWSRRFDKWMSPTLRNRWGPTRWGSHLGFRCATLAKDAGCAYGGPLEDGTCRHGVEDAECPPKQTFNGARCAKEGEPQCRPGASFEPGFGCRRPRTFKSDWQPSGDGTAGVEVTRSPRFDADCKTHQPERPKAYRFSGGTHLGRNQVGASRGCKNRDVGVGWNSACCP